MPRAMASTARVNSSREPVAAMRSSTQGTRRRPPKIISATKAATLPRVSSSGSSRPPSLPSDLPPSEPASAGSSTRVRTIARSSTISQPMAMRPRLVSMIPRCSRARSSTTVLATESARPNTSPPPISQSMNQARPMPSRVATAICTTAPGMAMDFTDSRSFSEKCRPTPNISRMTPSSAISCESAWSAT
ncbi:hypothetical protein D3C81_1444310 [compost metagenome]